MALAILTLARDNKASEIRAAVASGIPADLANDVSVGASGPAYCGLHAPGRQRSLSVLSIVAV